MPFNIQDEYLESMLLFHADQEDVRGGHFGDKSYLSPVSSRRRFSHEFERSDFNFSIWGGQEMKGSGAQLPGAWFYEDINENYPNTPLNDPEAEAVFMHSSSLLGVKNVTESVDVPTSEHVAEIVGRQGCKIKALRAKTNTYIKTPVRGEAPIFVVTGRPEDVEEAKHEIECAAVHFTQIRASRRHTQGGTPAPGQVIENIRVPLRVVGLVVGPKGATIKRIQQDTHTYIITPSRSNEPVFQVTGFPQNVARARLEIENHIFERTGAMPDALIAAQQLQSAARHNTFGFVPNQHRQSMPAYSQLGRLQQKMLQEEAFRQIVSVNDFGMGSLLKSFPSMRGSDEELGGGFARQNLVAPSPIQSNLKSSDFGCWGSTANVMENDVFDRAMAAHLGSLWTTSGRLSGLGLERDESPTNELVSLVEPSSGFGLTHSIWSDVSGRSSEPSTSPSSSPSSNNGDNEKTLVGNDTMTLLKFNGILRA